MFNKTEAFSCNLLSSSCGFVPMDWNALPIGKVTTLCQYGLSIAVHPEGEIPILGMKDILNGVINLQDLACTSVDESDIEKFCLKRGDILLNRTNSYDLVGKTGIFDSDELVVFASYLVRFQFDQKIIIPEFVNYCLNSYLGKQCLKRLATKGVSQANINPTIFREKFILPVPSLSEQKKIAEILRTWDEAIALTKKTIAAKQKLKKNLSEKVFSGFLNISNTFDEWRSERLGNISETFSGGTPSRSHTSYFEGNIPWIKSGEINQEIIFSAEEFISDEGFNNSSAKIIEPETILIAMYGATAGKIAVSKIRAAINQAILAVVPKSEIDRDFLYYFLKHRMDEIIRKVQGGQPNLNSKIIKETKILLPPFTEQVEIGKLLSLLDSETRSLERLQNLFEFQKQGLMQKLLTGKWRVTVESDA